MKVLKRALDFYVDVEPKVVPIWISLEHLPTQFYDMKTLQSIQKLIGESLIWDVLANPIAGPNVAQFCIEVDTEKPFLKTFLIARKDWVDGNTSLMKMSPCTTPLATS
ncbi:hypothetical protein ACH5RR_021608 [Cinchona calisaya]|uniref:DUF4283 domain-containing protein n=1 Tax=Cinchona calisaya TaxID=153742 RepID=A0ABD2ZIS9_9GENT